MPVPLTVVDSPYREITRPILDFVRRCAASRPRRGHRLHPRVRRRPLVGEPAAQPERAAAQGPAAVRAGRDGDQRAVAARLQRRTTWTGWRQAGRTPRAVRAADATSRATHRRRVHRGRRARPRRMSGHRARAGGRAGRARRALRGPRHDGQVVFVRHALPGERVLRRGSPTNQGYLRADAVEILLAVAGPGHPPCPYAGPGACGGCDLQHVDPGRAARLKVAVVREQLARLGGASARDRRLRTGGAAARRTAGLAVPGAVRGGRDRPGRAAQAPLARGGAVDRCLIAHPAIQDAAGDRPSGWPAGPTRGGRRRVRRGDSPC